MPYGTIVMADGKEVLFEIGVSEEYRGYLSEKGVIQGLKEYFGRIMDVVKETAQNANAGYLDIPDHARPKEFEISFGIKLNAEAGVIFSKIGSEGTFQVTLRWM